MKLLDRLFGRSAEPAAPDFPDCRHVQLAARWDDADAIGDHARASSYRCVACGAELTPEQARELTPTE